MTDVLTPVLTDNWDAERSWTLASYEERGGYDALRTAPARWGSTPVLFYGFDDLTVVGDRGTVTVSGDAVRTALTTSSGEIIP